MLICRFKKNRYAVLRRERHTEKARRLNKRTGVATTALDAPSAGWTMDGAASGLHYKKEGYGI